MKYEIGQIIYNRGDMANHEGWFKITAAIDDRWGKRYDMEEINGERKIPGIVEYSIHDIDKNNGLTRFVTKEAHEAMKKEMYENMMKRNR